MTLALILSLLLPAQPVSWVETSHLDFADGVVDPQMYVSLRAQNEPVPGCVEFFSRFDVDNNGYYDLACSEDSGPNLILYMGSDSGYHPASRLLYPIGSGGNVDLADLNLDGWAELIHSGWRDSQCVIYMGTPSGPSATDTTVLQYAGQAEDVNVYDLDKDAYLDVILGSDDGKLYIFWGGPEGHSTADHSEVVLGHAIGHNTEIADFDKDGWGDIATSMWTYNEMAIVFWGPNRAPRNTQWLPGRWNNFHGISVGDLDKNGWLDLVYTGYDTVVTTFVYFGSDSGFFAGNRTEIHPGMCYGGSALCDWNDDTWLDIMFMRGNWIHGGIWKPVVYYNTQGNGYFTDAWREDLGTDSVNSSGGFIADFNFDGIRDMFVNNMLNSDSSFILWGPAYLEQTALPADQDHHGVFREPGNVYDRSMTAFYTSSVFDAGPESAVVAGTCSWIAFEPPGTRVTVAFRAGDNPQPDFTWTRFFEVNGNGGPVPESCMDRRYLQYQVTFSYERPCFLPHLEQIATQFVLGGGPRYDVGVDAILAPPDVIDSGTTVVPVAVVTNYGNRPAMLPVQFRIDGQYSRSIGITLAVGQTDTLSFLPVWSANRCGSFAAICTAAMTRDANPSNNALRRNVLVRMADVAATGILAPVGVLRAGDTVRPRAKVENLGTGPEDFPVIFRVGAGYSDTVTVQGLAPDSALIVQFRPWVAEVGLQAVSCSTALAGDFWPYNDKVTDTVSVELTPVFDVGTEVIIAPTGVADTGMVIVPAARVRNYGTRLATFPVRMRIGTDYQDEATLTLAAGQGVMARFAPWTAAGRGVQLVSCSTAYVSDSNPSNDRKIDSVRVIIPNAPDVGVERILSPVGAVDSGTVLPVLAQVRNYGIKTATFPVRMRIDPSYDAVETLTLAGGMVDTVTFPDWSASLLGRHAVKCSTAYIDDPNPANDAALESVFVRRETLDVGVRAILAPLAMIDSGATSVPRAVVANFGNQPAAFPVECRIGTSYVARESLALAAGAEDTVSFPPWTANELGLVPVRCSTAWILDRVPANDWLEDSVLVVAPGVIDVGVVEIIAPTGTIDSGTNVTPAAVVENFGNRMARFPVRMQVGILYQNSVTITLAAGATDTVSFLGWTAWPDGVFPVRCSTMCAGDSNSANDLHSDSVRVVVKPTCDVGVVELLAPLGTLDSGTSVTPRAVVKNFGNQDAVFPTRFRIGSSYREEVTLTLAAGASDTASFPDWVASPRGMLAVACSTAWTLDTNPANDMLVDSVLVTVYAAYDVGVERIFAPVGTVDSGTLVTPAALVGNYGDHSATFPVRFYIGSSYAEEQVLTLDAGARDTVTFPKWPADVRGQFPVRCTTAYVNDSNPDNDCRRTTVTVRVRDVGATEILAPTGLVRANDRVIPRAVVTNFGTAPEDFDVLFRIGAVYFDTARVTGLLPQTSATVLFDQWSAVIGNHITACSTMLATDVAPENDSVLGGVRVNVKDVMVSPDTAGGVFPSLYTDYRMRVENFGISTDTIDLWTRGVRPDWATTMLDESKVNELPDLNGNGLRDIGGLSPGGIGWFTLRVTAPPGIRAYVAETTVVWGRSSRDTAEQDTAAVVTTVLPLASLAIAPDYYDSLAAGSYRDFELKVDNGGNIDDRVDLDIRRISGTPGWTYNLLDLAGDPLQDANHNGLPDVGPLPAFSGSATFKLRVGVPDYATPGDEDTVEIWAVSGTSPGVRSNVTVRTKALGGLFSLVVAPDQEDQQLTGTSRAYQLYVLTRGSASDIVQLSAATVQAGWDLKLLDAVGTTPLPDADQDLRGELGPVQPGAETPFTLLVNAPENVADDLSGDLDSLGKCYITVAGQSVRNPQLRDTATLAIQAIPRLAIHNFRNPFRDRTRFVFSVPAAGRVNLYVHNRAGELVSRPIADIEYEIGIHTLVWEAKNRAGRGLAPGTYLYTFEITDSRDGISRRLVKKLMIE